MNVTETAGMSSRKGQENGDETNDSDRPLKKARYAWQVKGKNRKKCNKNETVKVCTNTTSNHNKPESSGSSRPASGTEQDVQVIEECLVHQNLKDSPSTSSSDPPIPSTSFSWQRTQEQINRLRVMEEQCIARWQNKQIAKGCIDNTINRVIDLWIQSPAVPNYDASPSAQDVAELANNLPEDNTVENEGILMAISAHGLQNPELSRHSSVESIPMSDTDQEAVAKLTSLPETGPLTHDSNDNENCDHANPNIVSDTDGTYSVNSLNITWSFNNKHLDTCPHGRTYKYKDVRQTHELVTPGTVVVQNSCYDPIQFDDVDEDHIDFFNGAIALAIKTKGLNTLDDDYG